MRPVEELNTRMAPSPQQAARNFPSGENLIEKTSDVFSEMVMAGCNEQGCECGEGE